MTKLVGKKFNMLEVIEEIYVKGEKKTLIVKCDCGNIVERRRVCVEKGLTKSCGCLRRQNLELTLQKRVYKSHLSNAKLRNLVSYISFQDFVRIVKNPCVYCVKFPKEKLKLKASEDVLN